MFLKNLKLQNFRNYKELDFNFPSQNIVLVGDNTCGKTNFLESIFVSAIGKSFRANNLDLIFKDREFFKIEAKIYKENKEINLLVSFQKDNPQTKNIKINKKNKLIKDLFSILKIILFRPEDLELIGGEPALRRRMIDLILCETDIKYLYNLTLFRKTLKQRNFLLKRIKMGQSQVSELPIWDEKLIEPALYLIKKREEVIRFINPLICEVYKKISGEKVDLKIEYKPSFLDNYREALLKSKEIDIKSGLTIVGPHRDDLLFILGEKEMAGFCSRGEFRSAILALKLAEISFIKEVTKEKPILLLDDVFSELDQNRRRFLVEVLNDQQTIITTTDLAHLDLKCKNEAAIFRVENGEITPLI